MYRDAPAMGGVAVFEQIDALPCSSTAPCRPQGWLSGTGITGRFDMRGHCHLAYQLYGANRNIEGSIRRRHSRAK